MTTTSHDRGLASRVERIYLAALRVLTLAVASICLLGALGLAVDGGRRLLTPTTVKPELVTVSAEDALAPLVHADAQDKTRRDTIGGVSAAAKTQHAAFIGGLFDNYYQAYRQFAAAYNKPEDKLISRAELADLLGYTADAIDAPETVSSDRADNLAARDPEVAAQDAISKALGRSSRLFQTDSSFAQTQIDVIAKALADERLKSKASKYKMAQKTAQACSTVYQMRNVWDSNSTACDDWYYRPYGCAVRRSVPVEKCVPAYPEGVESPLETFVRLDEAYRLAWASKTSSARAAAEVKAAERQDVRAGAPAAFLLALQIFGGFLVVMFMFLLIAIERHLRSLAAARPAAEARTP